MSIEQNLLRVLVLRMSRSHVLLLPATTIMTDESNGESMTDHRDLMPITFFSSKIVTENTQIEQEQLSQHKRGGIIPNEAII